MFKPLLLKKLKNTNHYLYTNDMVIGAAKKWRGWAFAYFCFLPLPIRDRKINFSNALLLLFN